MLPGLARTAAGCTSILVTKGASVDGSVIITYSVDGEFHPTLRFTPAADHRPGELFEVKGRDGVVRLRIPQPAHTYAVTGIMNEHQLAIGETTFDGREELENKQGGLQYWTLMNLALQRSRTAREAVRVMADLVAEFGYASTGESFSIADPNEAWIMEMIGPGVGGKGAVWVAVRVPDGTISAHANKARIGTFPLDDPENCVYSANVIDFAIARGYFDPKTDGPFRFCEVYCPATAQKLRYTETRVWSIFRRAAPSLDLSPDYHRGVAGARPYPLWIKADRKLSVQDVIALMRDHYEGTPFDMTSGLDAGPFGSPMRSRPIPFKVDGADYSWERPISTQQTASSYVANSRGFLPDEVGGVLWYGVDDTFTTCYFPLYAGNTAVPPSFGRGSLQRFSWDSAWWVFNVVANFAQLKFSYMVKDIQKVQQELEGNFFALQPAIEKTALDMLRTDPQRARRFLTDYSVSAGEQVVRRWKELAETPVRQLQRRLRARRQRRRAGARLPGELAARGGQGKARAVQASPRRRPPQPRVVLTDQGPAARESGRGHGRSTLARGRRADSDCPSRRPGEPAAERPVADEEVVRPEAQDERHAADENVVQSRGERGPVQGDLDQAYEREVDEVDPVGGFREAAGRGPPSRTALTARPVTPRTESHEKRPYASPKPSRPGTAVVSPAAIRMASGTATAPAATEAARSGRARPANLASASGRRCSATPTTKKSAWYPSRAGDGTKLFRNPLTATGSRNRRGGQDREPERRAPRAERSRSPGARGVAFSRPR